MDIICSSCKSKFTISDDKLPKVKSATLPCPVCKSKLVIKPVPEPEPEPAPEPEPTFPDFMDAGVDSSMDSMESDIYDDGEKPFDFIEEEGKTALVCEQDPGNIKKINQGLSLLEFRMSLAENARDALRKMRYHTFEMIIVNENFDTRSPDSNGVLIYLERLSMSVRRDIYVVTLSNRFRTRDNMMALRNSVNLIINLKHINDIGSILQRGITDHEFFYRRFEEQMRDAGLA
ncbi:MAG: hypothetical protein GY859_38625 [Desulfobacterales bacterium]|nr:hypothetical protein [Desulfobacterales bacterium]